MEQLQFSAPLNVRHFRHSPLVRFAAVTRYQAGRSTVALAAVVDVTFLGSRCVEISWLIMMVNDG